MTVADLQRPRQAGALDVAGAAQRNRGIGRLTRRGKEDFRIDGLTYTACAPCQIFFTFL